MHCVIGDDCLHLLAAAALLIPSPSSSPHSRLQLQAVNHHEHSRGQPPSVCSASHAASRAAILERAEQPLPATSQCARQRQQLSRRRFALPRRRRLGISEQQLLHTPAVGQRRPQKLRAATASCARIRWLHAINSHVACCAAGWRTRGRTLARLGLGRWRGRLRGRQGFLQAGEVPLVVRAVQSFSRKHQVAQRPHAKSRRHARAGAADLRRGQRGSLRLVPLAPRAPRPSLTSDDEHQWHHAPDQHAPAALS